MSKIKAILDVFQAEAYHVAFRFTLCSTGRQVCGTVSGGESNVSAVFNHEQFRGWPWGAIYTTYRTVGVREYRNTTADWPYAGCAPDDIRAFVEKALRRRSTQD